MADFLLISTRCPKKGVVEIFPRFIIKRSADLMIRGGDFYAVWLEEKSLWSTDEQDALQLIDHELEKYYSENHESLEVYGEVRVLYMWDAASGMIDIWHKYCQKQLRDNYHMLDEKLIFADTEVKKKDYASKRLSYALEEGKCDAYDKLISTLYTEEERHKIEWAIGAVISGDSKKIQKFMVLYGAAGTGKSTVLHIIEDLFEGYCSGFRSSELGKSNSAFALEAFRNNPLVAIEHDGDLSRVEDNTRLNSLVSHEKMIVNEKFKSNYENAFKAFLFIGTNKPVKITDAKSGLLRRLIDVSPSGEKLSVREYNKLIRHVKFELGAIAFHCLKVYQSAPDKYDNYIPLTMMGATNDFYNFVSDSYFVFKRDNMTTLKAAWEMYKNYCDDARVPYPFSQKVFKEELKNYFVEYKERSTSKDGTRIRSCYIGFRLDKFEEQEEPYEDMHEEEKTWIDMKEQPSEFDRLYSDAAAQYATDKGSPQQPWSEVKTVLKDLSTDRLHYIRVPLYHVVVDLDLTDESGNKCLAKNLEAASKFPPTYAELSRSGQAVHLHYIYDGDVSKLDPKYAEHIEVKVFSGKSALRRKLTKCNDLPIAHISSGLPMKGEKMINFDGVKNERQLRRMIKKNLNKEYHAATKPSICFIDKLLNDAYKSGMPYDVTDMRNAILVFAASSTNQSEYCIKLVNDMKFKSEDTSINIDSDDERIIFYDCEVFPNLFLVNWKYAGEGKSVIRMINPKPQEIEELIRHRLVGFNCRRYDNHMLYGCLMGYNNEQLYNLSQRIISGSPNCFFGEAYNISYTDVYDFSSKKQSLKKFEIELGIHHQELGLPWDKPVPKEMWEKVAEYCDNDVIATEAVFNARKADFVAREILADVAGMTVNDTTNSLTTRIIFGRERKPQSKFNYRNMGDMSEVPNDITDVYTVFNKKGQPIFPGYKFEFNKSIYRGEEVGEGGYVYAEPGVYRNVALLDIASMHPSSIVAENLFGEYTQRFKDILDARLAIKHKDFNKARKMLGGALAKYLSDEGTAKDLAQALKIAINSVYGLTMASFDSPFRDKRNVDNIVAKRGALFMVNLKHEVQKRGFTVAHIKTDSIKIPDATPEIISFVTEYGKLYGYNFEHEATYEKMCLVNDAVYIAKYDGGDWTATGTQFQVPYVFKTLFSKEQIEFDDMCETKQVSTALYLDMNENLPNDEHNYTFVGRVGRFCPIRPGCGGGVLLREAKDKKTGNTVYAAATGSKGYRWLESETVKNRDISIIDRSYYDRLVEGAVEAIAKYDDTNTENAVRIFAEIDREDKNIRPEIQEILDNHEYLPF